MCVNVSSETNCSLSEQIILIPVKASIQHSEQSINNIILLKQYVKSIPSVFEALAAARGDLLVQIRAVCQYPFKFSPRN